MGKTKVLVVGSSLNDKGGIVTVIAGMMASAELKARCELRHIETYLHAGLARRAAVYFSGLLRFLLALLLFRPHVVHVHMSIRGSLYRKSVVIFLSRLFRIPVLAHMHGSDFQQFHAALGPVGRRYCRAVLNRCAKVIALSESWREYYSKIIPPERVITLYNAVPVPARDAMSFRNRRTVVHGLCLGRLGERKGTFDLLEAVRLLRLRGVPAVFTLAGDGEVDRARKLADELGISDCVRIPGWVDGDAKEALLAEADFFVLPSYFEGLPMAILEAMSRGIPVVSTPVGGIPEVVRHGENGFLVEPGDVLGLTEMMDRICVDPELRRSMGERGRADVESKFSLPIFAGRLADIYESVRKRKSAVCLASSTGGHLQGLLELLPIVQDRSYFVLTERNVTTIPLAEKHKTYYLLQQERMNISFFWKAAANVFLSAVALLKERPKVIMTCGAGAVVPACLLGKLFGAKLIFIESIAKVNTPTLTGRLLYWFADEFYVQWEELLRYYPGAKYRRTIF